MTIRVVTSTRLPSAQRKLGRHPPLVALRARGQRPAERFDPLTKADEAVAAAAAVGSGAPLGLAAREHPSFVTVTVSADRPLSRGRSHDDIHARRAGRMAANVRQRFDGDAVAGRGRPGASPRSASARTARCMSTEPVAAKRSVSSGRSSSP